MVFDSIILLLEFGIVDRIEKTTAEIHMWDKYHDPSTTDKTLTEDEHYNNNMNTYNNTYDCGANQMTHIVNCYTILRGVINMTS